MDTHSNTRSQKELRRLRREPKLVAPGPYDTDVDPFVLAIGGFLVAMIIALLLIGRFYPGSGLEQVGMRSARQITEQREELEAEDLDQMLAAHNARRRARGEREVSLEEVEMRVSRERNEQMQRREAYMADRDLDELLEATNARRRARGLPERTREEVRREYGGPAAGA
jgi:hypothetical protein